MEGVFQSPAWLFPWLQGGPVRPTPAPTVSNAFLVGLWRWRGHPGPLVLARVPAQLARHLPLQLVHLPISASFRQMGKAKLSSCTAKHRKAKHSTRRVSPQNSHHDTTPLQSAKCRCLSVFLCLCALSPVPYVLAHHSQILAGLDAAHGQART